MEIIKAYATKNPSYKEGRKIKPIGIVLHSTGVDNPNLSRYVDHPKAGANKYGNHWNREDCEVSVHEFVGYDKNKKIAVAQILPHDFACWGVGSGTKGSFNYDPTAHIQIEMCENKEDKDYTKKVVEVAIERMADICIKYNFNPLGKNVIVSHSEAHKLGYGSNHSDPEHWIGQYGYTMDGIRKAVKEKIAEKTKKEEEKKQTAEAIKVDYARSFDKSLAGEYRTVISTNLRCGASNDRKTITVIPSRKTVKCYGFFTRNDGLLWYFVEFNGKTGFVCSSALESPLKIGDSVKIRSGARFLSGQTVWKEVYNRKHKLIDLDGKRAVITYENVVIGAFDVKDLYKV